ncbi:MAG: enoyl-[acyl-carrier-protein] reductase FabK [Clostridia bacterium]|nr:enoyl-[acyl-carrier-protein] reductase FabK [Clostridia bacterium]
MTAKQRITEMFNIRYPIIQGGMAWVSDASLAAAVSEAGGLGVIAAGNAPANWVKEQIELLKSKTDKPFGVNVMLLSPFVDEVAQVVVESKADVIITGAGNPAKYMKMWQDTGAKVVPVVASSALAAMMEKMGADAVVAEGCEAGGHIGELTTMVLVPDILQSVSIPVVAAGGIYDSRTALAAFCLGADAIQVGTRFIMASECNAHQNYKDKIKKAKDIDSKVTGRVTGHPVRLIRNALARKMLAAEYEANAVEVLEEMGSGSLRAAVVEGDIKEGSFMAGQVACMLNDEMSAKEIIEEIFSNEKMTAVLKDASRFIK